MSLIMTEPEVKQIDSKVEQMMDWAKTRQAEAEQLALDSARLISCTSERMERLSNQGFFKRCWSRFTGEAGGMERANANDLVQMQKMAFSYINMVQEQQLLMAHSLLSLKNNLISLAVKEEETRNLIGMLAQRTLERFEKLETRVDQLEISTNLQGWLLGLEEREYDEKIPTDYMRLFRVINDFYQIKNDNWNYNDLMFMRKAIRTVGLNPKKKLSLNTFIDSLTDEIQSDEVGFDAYGEAITLYQPAGMDNYSNYVVENISSPVFATMHGLKTQYMDKLDTIEELQDTMNISASEALKRLLRRSIANMNVNLDYEFPLAETAIEILGCLRLGERLGNPSMRSDTIGISLSTSEKSITKYDQNISQQSSKNKNRKFVTDTSDILDLAKRIIQHLIPKFDNLNEDFFYLHLPYDEMKNFTGNDIKKIGKLPKNIEEILSNFENNIDFSDINGGIFTESCGAFVYNIQSAKMEYGLYYKNENEEIYGYANQEEWEKLGEMPEEMMFITGNSYAIIIKALKPYISKEKLKDLFN